MIQPKREYNNGLFDVQEIYDTAGYKILEQPTGQLWPATFDDPITIAKDRRNEYFETTEPVEERDVDSEGKEESENAIQSNEEEN